MKTVTTGKRNISLDIARIFPATMVVMIHVVIIEWFTLDVTGAQWNILNFYNMTASGAVPLFFLISGNLFLGKKELPGIKQLFGKYILKLAFFYLIWGLFYAMDTVGIRAVLSFDIPGIWKSFLYSPKYHLWYLPAMISVYLLLPVLWCTAHYEDGKYLGYACILFLLCRVIGFLNIFTRGIQAPNFTLYLIYELSGYSGYFLLGYELRRRNITIRSRYFAAGYLLVSLIGGGLGSVFSLREGGPNGIFLDFLGLFACIQSLLLYCAFLCCKPRLSDKAAGWISQLSKCTLFTYLFHPFVIEHLHDLYEFLARTMTPAAAVPLMTLLVQFICFSIGLILVRIPVVRRFLS